MKLKAASLQSVSRIIIYQFHAPDSQLVRVKSRSSQVSSATLTQRFHISTRNNMRERYKKKERYKKREMRIFWVLMTKLLTRNSKHTKNMLRATQESF